MIAMYLRRVGPAIVVGALMLPLLAAAQWNNPTGTPPNNNAATPINVSSTAQSKAGGLDVNSVLEASSLFVNGGDAIISGLGASNWRFLNFGATAGDTGYGFRNNNGTMEFKNSGGSWTSFASGGSLVWLSSGNNIYSTNSGNAGVGIAGPLVKLAIGDTDTGIHWVSDGNLALYTNNAERIRFNSSGNSGFGTTSPLERIHASGNIRGEGFCINASCITSWPSTSLLTSTQSANTVLAGPSSGGAALPTFRTMVAADIPALDTSKITTGVMATARLGTGTANNTTYLRGDGTWAAASGGVGGTGTTNYVPKFTAASTLGNSIIYDSGTAVGIGTPSPAQDLHIRDVSGGAFIDLEAAAASQSGIMMRGDREYRLVMRGNTDDAFSIRDQTAGVDRIFITSAGLVGINNSAPTQALHVTGSVLASSFLYSSDARLKHDIAVLDGSLEKLLALEPVSFTWNDDTPQARKEDIGFIAQQVEEIIPEAVNTDINGMKSVDYARLMPILVQAIQEQQREIDTLKDEVRSLKGGL